MVNLSDQTLSELCAQAIQAARLAGQIINYHCKQNITVEYKKIGKSIASQVVTKVDRQAQQAIIDILQPGCDQYDLALLAEEAEDDGLRHRKQAFWCIDPLDGTLAFINKTPGYAVSIALVSKAGKPLIGVVYDPLKNDLYYAIDGQGVFKNQQPVFISPLNYDQPLILQIDPGFKVDSRLQQTRSGLQEIASQLGFRQAEIRFQAGAVMNACSILDQPNRCYFKYSRQDNSGGSIWDYAATACLFNEAGGFASDISGVPLELNRVANCFLNHRGLLYAGTQQIAQKIIQLNKNINQK